MTQSYKNPPPTKFQTLTSEEQDGQGLVRIGGELGFVLRCSRLWLEIYAFIVISIYVCISMRMYVYVYIYIHTPTQRQRNRKRKGAGF